MVYTIAICFKKYLLNAQFLAHLSRRLTRWAYSIPMVRRCPHFQTWISLKPVGQSWSNFTCSITGVGERLHKVLGQIGSKQKAPIEWGKRCCHLFSVVFDLILFILAGNEDKHKISDEFEFWPDWTTDYGVSCLERLKISLRLIMGKWCLNASSFIFSSPEQHSRRVLYHPGCRR